MTVGGGPDPESRVVNPGPNSRPDVVEHWGVHAGRSALVADTARGESVGGRHQEMTYRMESVESPARPRRRLQLGIADRA